MISLIVGLALVGVILYLIETNLKIDPAILVLIRVVVVLCVIWFLMQAFGIPDLPLPHYRR